MSEDRESRFEHLLDVAGDEFRNTGKVDRFNATYDQEERLDLLRWSADFICRARPVMPAGDLVELETVARAIGAAFPFQGGNLFQDMLGFYAAVILGQEGIECHGSGDKKAFENWYRRNLLNIDQRFLICMMDTLEANKAAGNTKGVDAVERFQRDLGALSTTFMEQLTRKP